jgi:hypothetical protein
MGDNSGDPDVAPKSRRIAFKLWFGKAFDLGGSIAE